MSKSTKVVGPATVRAAFHSKALDHTSVTITRTVKGETVTEPANPASLFGGPQGKGRGRLAKPFVEAFLAANPGTKYAEKVESVPTIAVPTFDKRDRRTGRKVEIPLSEFRSLSGQAKGRPSAANIEAAGRAYSSARRSS